MRDLLFPDDCALVAHSHEDIQHIVNCLDNKRFGLTISLKKTEVLFSCVLSQLTFLFQLCLETNN